MCLHVKRPPSKLSLQAVLPAPAGPVVQPCGLTALAGSTPRPGARLKQERFGCCNGSVALPAPVGSGSHVAEPATLSNRTRRKLVRDKFGGVTYAIDSGVVDGDC